MEIVDLSPEDVDRIRQVAELLVEGFREYWPDAWPTIDAALREVETSFDAERISRVAIDESGAVVGWIGGIRQYSGFVWELHPLVVSSAHQRKGIGRALVADLEKQVLQRGGLTLWLGTDDDIGLTTLAGVDLYPDVLSHVAGIRDLGGHPFAFYQRLGFVIVGVMPDANGAGKPDIYMAKRVS